MMRKISVLLAILCVCLVSTASAHLGVIGSTDIDSEDAIEITGYGESAVSATYDHIDEDPFKGALTIYAFNSGSFAWTDFHIQITDPYNKGIENVDFVAGMIDDENWDPTSSQGDLTWNINNDVTGATIDLYFDDVVEIGTLATFTVYTDNTADMVDFGVCFYPTVPEPATLAILGLGSLALICRKR